MQPGGAAELETARQEVLQGHDLPGSPWDYSVQDWELVKEVPFRYRTPVEAVLLDMLQCSRPRCYLLGVMMRQHYRPTQSAPTEEHAEQVHKSLGAIMLARYLGRFAADLEQAAPSPAAVVARLGSQGALQVFAAAVELCRGWLPDDDEFVGASVIGGQQLLSVAEEDICAAPEVEDYPDWSRALSSTPVLAALRVRWPHEISKEKTAINAAKAAKAAAAAEPGVSGRRGGRRGGQGGGAASSGGGDLNQPSLADVAPAAEAAVHNAWQVLIAQLMGMLGREDGARLASTATGLLSSHFDEVLEQGRVPDAVVVEAFKDILPPGLPTSTVHARLAAMQPTHIDKQLSLLTKQPPGSAAWAASSSPQRQRAMQVERQKTGGAKTVVRLFADAAAAAAAGEAEQRPAEGTDGGQQGVGGQEGEEEEEEEGGMWQEAAAAAAAAEADEAAAAAAAAAAGAAADDDEEAQDEQQEEQQEEQDGGSVESEEEPQQQQQAQQVLQRGRQGLLVRAGAAGASRAAWSASSGGGASNSGEDDSDEEEASDGENDENWAPQHGKRGKRQRSGAAGGSGSGARTALQPAQQRRRLLAAQGFQMPRPAARAASGGSSATAGGKRSGTLGVARQMRN